MFKGLDLPVCDDLGSIQQKVKEKRERYLREGNSPDRDLAHKAKMWMKNAEAMENRRPDLLRVVYEAFRLDCDTAVHGAVASGNLRLTQHLLSDFNQKAISGFRLHPSLANEFVKRYVNERGFNEGDALVRPALVQQFTASSQISKIALQWTVPSRDFDEVEIIRESDSTGSKKKSETVYRGSGRVFEDTAVAPGTNYVYRAFSWFQGVKSDDAARLRTVCLGEVRSPLASYKDGNVELSWQLPGDGVNVLIFRRAGGVPSLRFAASGPVPADATTTQVFRGGGSKWADTAVVEGENYHYRIVAEFSGGLFTQGVDAQGTVPRTPPAPSAPRATYRHDHGRDEVELTWTGLPAGTPVDYIVVRREGNIPAAHVNDGKVVATIRQTRWRDDQVDAGRRYQYSVFTRLGTLESRAAAVAAVDILADVSDLRLQTGDGTVELQWKTPPNVTRVVVCRAVNPPQSLKYGTVVPLTSEGLAKDCGLQNGRRVHYLVTCCYRTDGHTELCSAGKRDEAQPEPLPEPPQDFKVWASGHEMHCSWTPPGHGTVVVLRGSKPHGLPVGSRLSSGEIQNHGEPVINTQNGRAVDPKPDVKKPYYSAFAVAGTHAVVGGTEARVVCPDVSDLRLTPVKDGIELRWLWPKECLSVMVARRADTWPTSHDDSRAVCVPVTHVDYRATGERFVQPLHDERGHFHYIVFAQATGTSGNFFSAGVEPTCRREIDWNPLLLLRYRLSACSGLRKGKGFKLTWNVEDPFSSFAGFALIANQTHVPKSLQDGTELYRWVPEEINPGEALEATVGLEPVRQRKWVRFYCKLMALDPAQGRSMLVTHPNISVPLTDKGEFEHAPLKDKPKIYRTGTPKEIVCPHCFHSFPVAAMLYTEFGNAGSEPVQGRYSWLDKMLRRPPRAPFNGQGRRMTRKLCPSCKADLPFTAGTQESLVIGLVGAKYSGKSSYVATLIHQLETRIGSDFQACLLPVADWTPERYKTHYYEPLFKDNLELRANPDSKPLIYDLSLDGRPWGEKHPRSVTLALYDTAGENFDDADKVRQMVAYLRVASGIIFLVDPLQAAKVAESLPPHVPKPPGMTEPNVIISNVLRELENGKVIADSASQVNIPVAVVLNKCDVLRDVGLMEVNRLWCTERRHIGYFDMEAHNDMAGMMGEYVQRWSPAAYNSVRQRFLRHAFFGVSATGCASDSGRYRYISPWRVEDPLLWLLAELGAVPIKKENSA